jgi:hypothetical protein
VHFDFLGDSNLGNDLDELLSNTSPAFQPCDASLAGSALHTDEGGGMERGTGRGRERGGGRRCVAAPKPETRDPKP